jgi:hypothetical protein
MNTTHKTLAEMKAALAKRFAAGEFVNVSDILGSDWGMGLPDCRGNFATFCAQAYQVAEARAALAKVHDEPRRR